MIINDELETGTNATVPTGEPTPFSCPDKDGNVVYYPTAEAMLEAMLSDKQLAKTGTKIVRSVNRANAAEAEADRERAAILRLELGTKFDSKVEALFRSEVITPWNEAGFETQLLAMVWSGMVQDGNQPGYAPGEIRCSVVSLAVPGIQSPLTIKSDKTVEDGKAETRTPDLGIVRGKSPSTGHDSN